MAMRQSGLGTSWLWPLGPDGAPPIGWEDAAAYLTLPLLLVAVQYASSSVTSPPIDPKDENANTQRALVRHNVCMWGGGPGTENPIGHRAGGLGQGLQPSKLGPIGVQRECGGDRRECGQVVRTRRHILVTLGARLRVVDTSGH